MDYRPHKTPSSEAEDSRMRTQRRRTVRGEARPAGRRRRRPLAALLLSPLAAAGGISAAKDDRNRVLNEAYPIPEVMRERGVEPLSPAASTRIINGLEVQNSRYPYAVSLQYSGEHFCGGALIAPDMVITAGHCNGSISLSGIIYNVVIGRHHLDRFYEGQSIRLKKEVRHPQYDEDTVNNDFNLVLLSRSVSGYKPLKVNNDPAIPSAPATGNALGEGLAVVGWGDTDSREDVQQSSDVLLETVVYAMTNERCEESEGMAASQWGPVWTDLKGGITDNMLCAKASNTDACQGDSGGPLIKKGNDSTGVDDVLCGIVSWGLGCADDAFPGVYSRVSAQYEWIKSNVCLLSADPPEWFSCPDQATAPSPFVPAPSPLSWTSLTQSTPEPMKQPTPQPTPPPTLPVTPAPTRSPIPDGKRRLLIVITLDDNPSETGWRLTTLSDEDENAAEDVIYHMRTGSYSSTDAEQTLQYEVLVDNEGLYNMTIYDTMGDGFGGTLEVYEDAIVSDSTMLVEEPGFTEVSGTAVTHGFYVGSSPTRALTLEFDFDYFAHEVAYEIKNDGDGVIFALAWFQRFDRGTESAKVSIPIYGPSRGDQEYTFRLWDSGGDGLCCGQWGDGSYKLYDGIVLLKSGGQYGAKETFQFTIEGDSPPSATPTSKPTDPPTPFPTPNPTYSPTGLPSMSPTDNPTKKPATPGPSSQPITPEPTSIPTKNPTPRPIFLGGSLITPIPTKNPTMRPIFLELPAESPPLPVPQPSSVPPANATTPSPSELVYSTSAMSSLARPVHVTSDASSDVVPTSVPTAAPVVFLLPAGNDSTAISVEVDGADTNTAETVVTRAATADPSSAAIGMLRRGGCWSNVMSLSVVIGLFSVWLAF